MIEKIIHAIACVFMFAVVVFSGMVIFLFPWIYVMEAGCPTAGVVMAAVYDACLLAVIADNL